MFRTIQPIRTAFQRRAASSSAPQQPQNQQVQQAVEQAQKVYDAAAATVKRVGGPIGDKIGGMMGGYAAPLKYNSKVAASVARQVYQAEKLAPPTNLSAWANAYAQIWARGTSAQWYQTIMKNGEWAKVGVYALEAYGIFKVGEIIGRRNLVGYKLKE